MRLDILAERIKSMIKYEFGFNRNGGGEIDYNEKKLTIKNIRIIFVYNKSYNIFVNLINH